MNLRKMFIYSCFYVPYIFHKITGTGSFGSNRAIYIKNQIIAEGNPLKASLIKYHVKQYHEASCSVATVVSVINAIIEQQMNKHVLVTQKAILEKVKTANWKKRMSEKGDNGKRGLPLSVLGEVLKDSLDAYGINYKAIEIVQASKDYDKAQKIKNKLLTRLIEFERKGNCLIIAHFDQGAFVQTLNIPHISPVGAFDIQSGDIIMLDVDPEQVRPYKISFDIFYEGLSSNYNHLLKPFGFGSGGYIAIILA
ncbi:MAG: phytochelatin synthase [Desulfobacterales bacterium]|nr:phytochelatin synthase [Desulfobacterales bacterium]MBF0396594.1 phytochelatin synthase [Desulfobacterales bacterium]